MDKEKCVSKDGTKYLDINCLASIAGFSVDTAGNNIQLMVETQRDSAANVIKYADMCDCCNNMIYVFHVLQGNLEIGATTDLVDRIEKLVNEFIEFLMDEINKNLKYFLDNESAESFMEGVVSNGKNVNYNLSLIFEFICSFIDGSADEIKAKFISDMDGKLLFLIEKLGLESFLKRGVEIKFDS